MLNVLPIPALDSNYFWLVQPVPGSPLAYIIDPGQAAPVLKALAQHELQLAGIIITHRHHDHIGGVEELVQCFDVPVYGPHSRAIPQISHHVSHGDTLNLPDFALEVIAVPGHTLDHHAYIHRPDSSASALNSPTLNSPILNNPALSSPGLNSPALLFCGDTLFAGGCGRLFDGSADQLHDSLMALATLPDDTLVYCAHEYTLDNLRFAQTVEPDNHDLVERFHAVKSQRQRGEMTLPTTIGMEKRTNPFLRVHMQSVRQAAEEFCGHDLGCGREVFAIVRGWKDRFRPILDDNFD